MDTVLIVAAFVIMAANLWLAWRIVSDLFDGFVSLIDAVGKLLGLK